MRILIVGAGDIGFQLSKRLCGEKHDITIIESDPQMAARAREQLDALVIEGSGTSYRLLQEAGLEYMETVAAMTDNDEANLLVCRMAKKVSDATTIARVRNVEFTLPDFILSPIEMGTDYLIHPEIETAQSILQLIHQSNTTYAVEFEGGKIQVFGVRLDRHSPLLNKPLIELSQSYDNEHVRIVAVERNHKTLIPKGNDRLLAGDNVFVVCDHHYRDEFIKFMGKEDIPISNVMILGGGLVGQHVAASLAKEANVKLIEGDAERAEKIADELPGVLVIHGDGTDFDLMSEEGLADMDAFVAVTGNDENNMITTLLARHLNVPRAIALVNKIDYLPITPTIDIDTVVSKQLLTANAVLHLIQKEIALIASPPGLDTQIIEYIVNGNSKITRRPLIDVNFPSDAIVGAVLRGDNVLIPHGDTQIQPDDRAVVFALPDAIYRVDRLFGV